MKVLYHIPSLHTVYAHRTIYNGFKHAFSDLGHEFRPLTSDQRSSEVFRGYEPDIFITSSHAWYRSYLDFDELRRQRDQGTFVLVKIDFWNSPFSKSRINEAPSLKDDKTLIKLIQNQLFGDAYFHVVEQEDSRMDGFERTTGEPFHTIPLAADATVLSPVFDARFQSDISYVGTNLPDKRDFFDKYVRPLRSQYNLKLYGQDWSLIERYISWVQRFGQYLNIPILRSIRKPKLDLEDEAKIYRSSGVSINVHEAYQKQFGGDCNERTFKIPLAGGFQVVDEVACIRKYFDADHEIVIAENPSDWLDKVHYFLKNPDERQPFIEAGRKKVLDQHTYHHRAKHILSIRNQAKHG